MCRRTLSRQRTLRARGGARVRRYVRGGEDDIFSPVCDGYVKYEAQRRADCLEPFVDEDPYTSGGCFNIRASLCPHSPFDELCLNDETYAPQRARHRVACRAAPSNEADCQNLPAARPNSESWLGGFTTETFPPTAADASLSENAFLRGTADGLDVGDVKARDDTAPAVFTLNLSDSELRGEVADGVAFFAGVIGGAEYFYTGLLAGADLGELLTHDSGTARWDGRIRGLAGGFNLNRFIPESDFTLEIGFNANGGTIQAFVPSASVTDTYFLYLDGSFDNTGRIDGTTNFARFAGDVRDGATTDDSTGTFNGIIGSQGALGVFLSDSDGANNSYGGGFVARDVPPADYATWAQTVDLRAGGASGFDEPSNFIQGGTEANNGLDLGSQVTRGKSTTSAINTNEGFAIARGTSNGNIFYYSGILTGTGTLGGPIDSGGEAVVRYTDRARLILGEQLIEMDNFVLTVTLDGRSFAGEASSASGEFTLEIANGRFTGGLITHGDAALINTMDNTYSLGTVSGIIGNEAAIGVIRTNDNPGTLGHFAGGFIGTRAP